MRKSAQKTKTVNTEEGDKKWQMGWNNEEGFNDNKNKAGVVLAIVVLLPNFISLPCLAVFLYCFLCKIICKNMRNARNPGPALLTKRNKASFNSYRWCQWCQQISQFNRMSLWWMNGLTADKGVTAPEKPSSAHFITCIFKLKVNHTSELTAT